MLSLSKAVNGYYNLNKNNLPNMIHPNDDHYIPYKNKYIKDQDGDLTTCVYDVNCFCFNGYYLYVVFVLTFHWGPSWS